MVQFKFLITSIDADNVAGVETPNPAIYGEGAKVVVFDGETHNKNDTDMLFLMNVKVLNPDADVNDAKKKVEGVSVSKEWFKQSLNEFTRRQHNGKVLVCVHGFAVEPAYWMKECDLKLKQSKVKAFREVNPYILPTIWPAKQLPAYLSTQELSANAGKVFGDNITFLDEDSGMSLSLMCHSMGGRTLLYFAKQLPMFPTQPFDHLFFVAADEIGQEETNASLKLCRAVKKSDPNNPREKKVHIYYNRTDIALGASNGLNVRARIGHHGTVREQSITVHPECMHVLRNVDFNEHLADEINKVDNSVKHSYQFMDHLVQDYAKCMSDGYKSTDPDGDEFYDTALENTTN